MSNHAMKLEELKRNLRELGKVAVAFSGGVDSTFLLKVSQEVLGEKVLALTAKSKFVPQSEIESAQKICAELGIRQIILEEDVLGIDGIADNPVNRCYLCKRALFEKFMKQAEDKILVEGTNVDDVGDYRPGMKALEELEVKSPLREAGLTKAEIRELSKEMKLSTWDKPSRACLASRIPYWEKLTTEKLLQVEEAEEILIGKGLGQLRVRVHGKIARLEVMPEKFPKLLKIREEITERLKRIGFDYVTVDLQGYRTGSMNEVV